MREDVFNFVLGPGLPQGLGCPLRQIGHGEIQIIQHSQVAQQLCPEGVLGPIFRNRHATYVWGLRPHIFITLLLRNLGPQIPLRTQMLHNFIILCFFSVPGDGQLPPQGILWEGPGGHFQLEIEGLRPVPARLRVVIHVSFS